MTVLLQAFSNIWMEGIMADTDAALVDTDFVISLIQVAADIILLTRSIW